MIDFGEIVKLGPIDFIGADKIRSWRNDYSIWKWSRQNDLLLMQNQTDWLNSLPHRGDAKYYSIVSLTNNGVGVCGLSDIDPVSRRAEFSIYIAPNEQGCGYAKPALKTLISHGFNNLGLNTIWGETFTENERASKLFESIGFKLEGVRRSHYFKDGKFTDSKLYSILFDEWKASESFKREQL